MALTPEGRVKLAIKRVLLEKKIWFYMPIQNGMGRVGIPDFICCMQGRFIAIEAKAPGKLNQLTKNQQQVQNEIINNGGHSFVVDCAVYLRALLAIIETAP